MVRWDRYFLDIAKAVAERATCDRLHVGVVVVRDRSILATGYNGAPSRADHCDDVGHLLRDGHCIRTVHAEINALAMAAKHGVRLEGSTCYLTHTPCYNCLKTLVNAGVKEVVYEVEYRRDELLSALAAQTGINIRKHEEGDAGVRHVP